MTDFDAADFTPAEWAEFLDARAYARKGHAWDAELPSTRGANAELWLPAAAEQLWRVCDLSNWNPGTAAALIAENDACYLQVGVPLFDVHLAECERQGKPVGAYCWCYPGRDVTAELARFAGLLAPYETRLSLRTALDVERTPGLVTPPASRTIAWLEAWFAARPQDWPYASPGEWSAMVGSWGGLGALDLWVAGYGVSAPRLPPGWGSWAGWQYTSSPYDRSVMVPAKVTRSAAPAPIPAPMPGGDDMPLAFTCEDPQTRSGSWLVTPDGSVFADDGAPYLGGLNNHPEWHAVDFAHPIVGVVPWWDPAGTGWGYKIVQADPTRPAGQAPFRSYRFTRDGRYATAVKVA